MSTRTDVDAIVVGLGVAGCLVALGLKQRGLRVFAFDPAEPRTASRTAAGVFAPVHGRRLGLPDLALPPADTLAVVHRVWRDAADVLDTPVWAPRPVWRALRLGQTRQAWTDKQGKLTGWARPLAGAPDPQDAVDAAGQAGAVDGQATWIEVLRGGVVDFRVLLDGTAALLAADGALSRHVVRDDDVEFTADGVVVRATDGHAVHAQHVFFCRGIAERDSAIAPTLDVRANAGQTLRFDTLHWDGPGAGMGGDTGGADAARWSTALDTVALNDGVLAVRLHDGTYRVGGTYDGDTAPVPTAEGEAALRAKLAAAGLHAGAVVSHDAGVRPVVRDRRCAVGRAAVDTRAIVVNGLGSRGTLWGPLAADAAIALALDDTPVPPVFSLARKGAQRGDA